MVAAGAIRPVMAVDGWRRLIRTIASIVRLRGHPAQRRTMRAASICTSSVCRSPTTTRKVRVHSNAVHSPPHEASRPTMASSKTATLTLRITPPLKMALQASATMEHRSVANMVEVMIRDYCERHRIAVPAVESDTAARPNASRHNSK